MQWFKRFFELKVPEGFEYDRAGSRTKGKGGAEYNKAHSKGTTASAAISRPAATKAAPTAPPKIEKSSSLNKIVSQKENRANVTVTNVKESAPVKPSTAPGSTEVVKQLESKDSELAELRLANERLTKNNAELRIEVDGVEKERDFYFDKLREIEVMLQDLDESSKNNTVTQSIFKILYATADGFEQVEGEGEVEGESMVMQTEIEA